MDNDEPKTSESEQQSTGDREGDNGSGLEWRETIRGQAPGDRYIRINRHQAFQRVRPGMIQPRDSEVEPSTKVGKLISGVRRRLLGPPISSASELEQRVNIPRGLAIFASDNISSSAYATEEMMRVLAVAGFSALALTLPITLAVMVVLAVVITSYVQVIRAYPSGGGSYVVSHENLGPIAGLVAAGSLLTDYILTVAVSISAGVAAITSAFPELYDFRVSIAIGVIALMTLINLRGLREAGNIFAVPTYAYVVCILIVLAIGMGRYLTGNLPVHEPPPSWVADLGTESIGIMLVLRAFATGSVGLSGTEAVSNGVPVFRKPEVRNAQLTLVLMGTLFGTIFFGLGFLARHLKIVPDPDEVQTVTSLVTSEIVGDGAFYLIVQFSTALILLLAANTAFNGFPILASILAKDQYLPRAFSYRGNRLAYTAGILMLSIVAGLLVWIYEASVTGLIPLYTVGVFLAFTLSQAGLVRHWLHNRDFKGWQWRLVINATGATVTGVVAIVVGVTKFLLGAWMVLVLIPILVWVMWNIHAHYRRVQLSELAEPEYPIDPEDVSIRAIVPISNLRLPARQAIAYAHAIASEDQVTTVHITDDPEQAEQIRQEWRSLDLPGQFVVIESPYRSLLGPLMTYVEAVAEIQPKATITVVLPEYVPRHWWEHLLHNQTAFRLKAALLFQPKLVVTSVPYHMRT